MTNRQVVHFRQHCGQTCINSRADSTVYKMLEDALFCQKNPLVSMKEVQMTSCLQNRKQERMM